MVAQERNVYIRVKPGCVDFVIEDLRKKDPTCDMKVYGNSIDVYTVLEVKELMAINGITSVTEP